MIDLFTDNLLSDPIKPVRPTALGKTEWPPDYKGVLAWRIRQLQRLRADPRMLEAAKIYYSTRPSEFIMHWMDTFDPRRTDNKWIPFIFFERQVDLVDFLHGCYQDGENGLVEKCRDAGATWVSCAYSTWRWLFVPNDAIGWGSRKADLVDQIGNVDSIFEKLRLLVHRLPNVFKPQGFSPRNHATYMRLINPANGAVITGESGDNIGRGGRSSGYFKDEAQPLDAKILTPHGWVDMGSITVGDYVIGANGQPTKVVNINKCGKHPVYRVELTDGTSTRCSQNHLWTVEKYGRKKTLPLSEIIQKYRYISPRGQIQYPYRVERNKPVEYSNQGSLPLNPYVVGALLGDGSVGSVPKHGCSFTSVDVEVIAAIACRLPEGVKITNSKGEINYRIVDVRGVGVKKSRARQTIVDSGIAGMIHHNKRIPEKYLRSSLENRLELLQGLMDTDGSAANGGYPTFHTSSTGLANDVAELVRSLGGTASISRKKDKRGYLDQMVVYVNLPSFFDVFKMARKQKAVAVRKQQSNKAIRSIEYVGELEVQCISVSSPDGLYITDDFIVTHNSAFYERPEKIEAALGDNTNVQIDISSVNGLGNVFHRRRKDGVEWYRGADLPKGAVRVFTFDWADHPAKTQEWYDTRRAKAEREGMLHIFASEVERNYAAAVSNTIISKEWIQAAVDAHMKVPSLIEAGVIDRWGAGLDVADQGTDRNAIAFRQGIIIREVEEWGERDVGVTTRRAVLACRNHMPLKVQYDSVGLGAGVKSEYNRLCDIGEINKNRITFVPWNAGAKVQKPFARVIPDDLESPTNKAMFFNLKAQAWWDLRTRFYKTYRAVTDGIRYPADELISLDSRMPLLHQLINELAQPTKGDSSTLQMLVNKKPEGEKSPNLADAVVMCMFPVDDENGKVVIGTY